MSDETETQEDQELKEMEQQILAAEAEKAKAAEPLIEETPSPEPEVSPAPEPITTPDVPVTPTSEANSQTEKPKDDPMEWAKKKGFKSPEDMARALLKRDQEYHESRQKAEREAAPPPPPQWQPTPQMGYGQPQPNYGYQQPQQRINPRDLAPYYPSLAPEDVERVMPLVLDAAEVISNRKVAALEQRWGTQFGAMQRQTERNNELMSLMQDPAFRNEGVQQEIHAVLDSNQTLLQRPDAMTQAFNQALANLARKQLQQGVIPETSTPNNKPPVTAGGGNGSANTTPFRVTEEIMNSWTMEQADAYMKSNGRIVPKR